MSCLLHGRQPNETCRDSMQQECSATGCRSRTTLLQKHRGQEGHCTHQSHPTVIYFHTLKAFSLHLSISMTNATRLQTRPSATPQRSPMASSHGKQPDLPQQAWTHLVRYLSSCLWPTPGQGSPSHGIQEDWRGRSPPLH